MLKLMNRLIFKKKALYAHFGITHRCNLSCRMCKIKTDLKEGAELSLKQIEEVFDNLKSLGVLYVSIGGGEPVLRNDLPDVIKLMISKGFMVRLLTNGALADERLINDLALAGLREVSISLDTLDPQKFSYICGNGAQINKIVQNIELFSRILPKSNRLLLLNTVVSALNIQEIPRLLRFAGEKGFYMSFLPIEADEGSGELVFNQQDHRHIDESYDYLINAKSQRRNAVFNSSVFLEKSRRYLKYKAIDWQCDAGKLYFSLSPNGELSACHKFNNRVSLLGSGIKSDFVLKELKTTSERLIKACPGCMRPCWAEISFLSRDISSLWQMCKIKLQNL